MGFKSFQTLLQLCFIFLLALPCTSSNAALMPTKEWTFLIFMNGNNDLDLYGSLDLNEMEKVGSTENINVVVQWASYQRKDTHRVLVTKDEDPQKVSSLLLENLGQIDMGDSKNLVNFIEWGVKEFPAKRYFINVWNHGSGWHLMRNRFSTRDISWDDFTGNSIKTEQLGEAMAKAAEIIGHKVDLYGSDACLMGMAEVADEMADSVDIYIGSEETEPLEGWPYDKLLENWVKLVESTPQQVAQILVSEYVKSYNGGSQGNQQVTQAAYDLSKREALYDAVIKLGKQIRSLPEKEKEKVIAIIYKSLNFYSYDFKDLFDFALNLKNAQLFSALESEEVFSAIEQALKEFVIANETTSSYSKARGVAIWLPDYEYYYSRHIQRYKGLRFHAHTSWGDTLEFLFKKEPLPPPKNHTPEI